MINTKLTTVTPKMASEMLKSNTHNRPIRMPHVNRLKTEIVAGRWLITHQGIAFAEDGSLLDGQHRLMAIEAAGKSVQIMVTNGLPKSHNGDINLSTMDVIDNGRPRKTSDQLHLSHGVLNTNLVCSILRNIAVVFNSQNKVAGSITVGQALGMLEIYKDGIDELYPIANTSKKLCLKGAIMAAVCIAYKVAPKESVTFMKQLANGSGIGVGDPVYALRESLIAYPPMGTEQERVNLVHRVTAALYNTLQGNPIKTAKVSKIGLDYFMAQDKKSVAKVRSLILGE